MRYFIALGQFLTWLTLAITAGSAVVLSGAFLYLSPDLPSVEALKDVQLQTPLRVYTRDEKLIGEFGEQRRIPLHADEIPPLFIKAILAAEDDRFFDHRGVDLKGLFRASYQLINSGDIQTGGSTITMQVAKNYFLTSEKTFKRKFNEILLALQIERTLTKEEIMVLYVNKIFLGNRAYGIGAAAQVYYGKSIKELNLAELAMIAGLPKAPSIYNPLVNPKRAGIRRDWILGRMLSLDYITQAEHDEAIAAPPVARYHGTQLDMDGSYAAEMVRQYMEAQFGSDAFISGYKAYTTLDSKLLAAGNHAVREGLLAYDWKHGWRGAEKNIDISDSERTLATLRGIPSVADLLPAAVIKLEEKAIDAVLADGQPLRLEWIDGLSTARRFISMNRRDKAPKTAADVVAVGDIIRVRKVGERWTLSQVPAAQSALISLDASNGAILSVVGGFDYRASKFNRAVQGSRQPGSSFKPLLYTAALAHGFTPATIINDAPIVFNDANGDVWRPGNSEGDFMGPLRLRVALYKSRNLVSIRLLQQLGIERAIRFLDRFGIDNKKLMPNLSLALGTAEQTPLAMATAFSVLANQGFRVEPFIVSKVTDNDGNTLFEARPPTVCLACEVQAEAEAKRLAAEAEAAAANLDLEQEADNLEQLLEKVENPAIVAVATPPQVTLPAAPRVIDKGVAFLIDNMLQDVIKKGTGRKALELKRRDLAGKTGTTNGPNDAWFSGYSSGAQIATTVWVGMDNNTTLGRTDYGGTVALPIWIDYMKVALDGKSDQPPLPPSNVVTMRINEQTGQRARPGERGVFEVFLQKENAAVNTTATSSATDMTNQRATETSPINAAQMPVEKTPEVLEQEPEDIF